MLTDANAFRNCKILFTYHINHLSGESTSSLPEDGWDEDDSDEDDSGGYQDYYR